MKEQDAVKGSQIRIDEPTTRAIMSHYKIDSHDELVRYIRRLGIKHDD